MSQETTTIQTLQSVNFKAAFESIPGAHILLQADPPRFSIITITDDHFFISGKNRIELKGLGLFEAFPPNNNDPDFYGDQELSESFQQVIDCKKPHQLPVQRYDMLNDKGEFEARYWSARNKPVLDADGHVQYIIHSVVDITSQVNAGRLEEKRWGIEKSHNLFLQIPASVMIFKGEENIIELANKTALKIMGKTEDIIGKPISVALPDAHKQGISDILNKVRSSGQPFTSNETRVLLYGSTTERYFDIVYQPIYEQHTENATGVFTISHDVTELVQTRKKIEEERSQTEKQQRLYEAINGSTPDLIYVFDLTYRFTYVNKALLNMWGKTLQESIGKSLLENGYEPWHAEMHEREIDQVVATRKPIRGVVSFPHATMGKRVYDYILVPVINLKGEVEAVAGTTRDITQIKEIEQQLRTSHERFEAAIEAIHGTLWTNNAEGQMIGEQKGWEELTGQKFDDYQGTGWSKMVHPDDAQPTIDAWNDAVKEKKNFDFKHRLKVKNGEYRFFSIRAIPLMNKDGVIHEWVGVHTDITEQTKVEERIRESEERFRKLADESPMFVFIVESDPNAPVSYWNKTWLEYTGQNFEEAQGNAWNGLLHQEDLPVIMEHYTSAFERQQSYFIPAVRVKRHDGEYRWHAFKGNPRYSTDGGFNGYIGVGFDIHEQKISEDLIKTSEAQLQIKVAERTAELESQKNLLDNILTNSSNGISVTEMIRNDKGHVIDASTILANDAAVRFTGLPKDVYLSKTARDLDPDILITPYGKTCLNTLETGEPSIIQYFLEATGRWLELTISKMDDDHLIHIFTDVTHIKESHLQLERTVEELKRSNQNLEEFAYAASHDLKEPIRKVHFFSERIKTALGERMNEEEKKFFERMEVASKRMGLLVDDLLSYSQVSLRPKKFDEVNLNGLVNTVLEDLDVEIESRKAVIEVANLGNIYGHHRQLQQAFQNLIGNALKYSRQDVPPIIQITSHQVSGKEMGIHLNTDELKKTYHVIKIKDNGIGFEQYDADRIFNVFTRLHGNAEFRGTGVGLSIVRKVMENHHGFVTAEGEPMKGATFTLVFPSKH